MISLFTFTINEVDARCLGPYPCSAPGSLPLATQYWQYSDTVIYGKVVAKLYHENALDNFDSNNLENPCHLTTKEKKLTVNMEKPFSQRIQNTLQPTIWANFLKSSEHNSPFKVRIQVEQVYKGTVFFKYLDVYGIELSPGQQFSKGYMVNPDVGEDVLLYMNYFESIPFGSCQMKEAYQVGYTQGSIWGWNFEDYKPDIYPGDVEIIPWSEQLEQIQVNENSSIWDMRYQYQQLVCPLGKEIMFKVYDIADTPLCIHYKDTPKLESIDYAYRVNTWESWNKYYDKFFSEKEGFVWNYVDNK